MATFIPAQDRRAKSPHLPLGDRRDAPFYGKDIISVSQFGREDLEYIFGVAREMRAMVERVGTIDPDLLLVPCRHGAAGRKRDPDQ
jgi:hypothetical protein